MLNHLITQAAPLLGAAVMPAYRYLGEARYAKLEYYNAARTRSRSAEFVLNMFATMTASVSLANDVTREELFERYDVKLWSFDDQVTLFAIATIPSIAALGVLYAAFRGAERVRALCE